MPLSGGDVNESPACLGEGKGDGAEGAVERLLQPDGVLLLLLLLLLVSLPPPPPTPTEESARIF